MGQDKMGGDSVYSRLGGESAQTLHASGDDDVEGHKFTVNADDDEKPGTSSYRATEGDDADVEGHKFTLNAKTERADDEDDVEGHKHQV